MANVLIAWPKLHPQFVLQEGNGFLALLDFSRALEDGAQPERDEGEFAPEGISTGRAESASVQSTPASVRGTPSEAS
jgi:hypothetical protein